MKGVALEYVFKMFLYVVVVTVVISLIIRFREEISSSLRFCEFLPGGCRETECETIQATEEKLTEAVVKKYCNFCWEKTGVKDYRKDCICYVVKGSFSPNQFTGLGEYCELKCQKEATSLIFTYSQLIRKILIEC